MAEAIQQILSQNEDLIKQNKELQINSIKHLEEDRQDAQMRRIKAREQINQTLIDEKQIERDLINSSQVRFGSVFKKRRQAAQEDFSAGLEGKLVLKSISKEAQKVTRLNKDLRNLPFRRLQAEQENKQRIQEQTRNEVNRMFSLSSPQMSELERLNKLRN